MLNRDESDSSTIFFLFFFFLLKVIDADSKSSWNQSNSSWVDLIFFSKCEKCVYNNRKLVKTSKTKKYGNFNPKIFIHDISVNFSSKLTELFDNLVLGAFQIRHKRATAFKSNYNHWIHNKTFFETNFFGHKMRCSMFHFLKCPKCGVFTNITKWNKTHTDKLGT